MEKGEKISRNIAKIFEQTLIEKNISKGDLAKRSGTTQNNVSYFLQKLKKGKGINLTTLYKYSEILGVDPIIFFAQNRNEKLEEIIIDCFLSSEEKKVIQKIIDENEEIVKQLKTKVTIKTGQEELIWII